MFPVRLSREVIPGQIRDEPTNQLMKRVKSALDILGQQGQSVVKIFANYYATIEEFYILANANDVAITLFLPNAADAIHSVGIKKIDASANTVIVTPVPGQTIDGAGSLTLTVQYEVYTLVSDGQNWSIF